MKIIQKDQASYFQFKSLSSYKNLLGEFEKNNLETEMRKIFIAKEKYKNIHRLFLEEIKNNPVKFIKWFPWL